MTVMLLQRFSAPQSNLTKKKFYHSCDNDIGNNSGQQTVKIKTKNNKKQLKDKKDSLETSTSYYSNNILSNTITTTNNNNNNNTNNNNNNNSENIENNCEEFCKNEKYHCTGSCLNKKTVTNININNSNNNSNNNNIINNNNNNNNNNININNNNNNNEEEREEDEFLTRDKQNIRQETITSHTTTITGGTTGTIGTSVSQNRYYSQGVAMRYYRLWIYACNIVLLGSALGLALALLRSLVFTRDPRRYLVPGVPRVFDPTALYAYLALATQLGLVQLLGCIAARRLSAKLLNAYWVLLLALLFGDAIIGVAWVFRFEKIRAELRPTLKLKLQLDYGRDQRFSDNWDRLQRDFSCCGVTGPGDYPTRFYPETCCPIDLNKYIQSQSANNNNNKNINYNKNNNNYNKNNNNNYNNNNDTNISSYNNACHQPYSHGCEENLISWMRKTADLLFVIGFCVMAFSKLCFLGILRYEIREMIQKIQLLRDPPPPASATFIQSFCQVPSQVTTIQNNNNATTTTTTTTTTGGITTGTTTISDTSGYCHSNYGGTRRTTLPIVVSSSIVNNNPTGFGNNMPVSYEQDYNGKHPLLFTSNLQQDTGADSDTNSHCALILEESTTTPPCQRNYTTAINSQREKNNGNNNNNNNYEMREFNRRYLMSNGTGSPPSGIKIIPQNRRT